MEFPALIKSLPFMSMLTETVPFCVGLTSHDTVTTIGDPYGPDTISVNEPPFSSKKPLLNRFGPTVCITSRA